MTAHLGRLGRFPFFGNSSRPDLARTLRLRLYLEKWQALRIDPVSLQVGRPRPNFVALCWPDGAVVWDKDTGLAVCSPNAMNPAEGRKSFPSGDQLFHMLFL